MTDAWRERQGEGHVMKPSRPASIRWIVHQFLLQQEQKAKTAGKRKAKRKPARRA